MVKARPFLDDGLGLVRIVESRPTVTGLNAGTKVFGQVPFIVLEMLREGFEGRRRAAAMILDQREHHPAHAGSLAPGAVINILPGDENLEVARQAPVLLAIAH